MGGKFVLIYDANDGQCQAFLKQMIQSGCQKYFVTTKSLNDFYTGPFMPKQLPAIQCACCCSEGEGEGEGSHCSSHKKASFYVEGAKAFEFLGHLAKDAAVAKHSEFIRRA